jgi:hypothetical protein
MLSHDLALPTDSKLVFSILAKPAGRGHLALWLRGPRECDDMVETFFDLVAGTVTHTARYGNGQLGAAGIEAVGDGWMRCTLSGRPSTLADKARASVLLRAGSEGSSSYAGDGRSGVCLAFPLFSVAAE